MNRILFFTLLLFSSLAQAAPQDYGVTYDIVYVRYPMNPLTGNYIVIPSGETPYNIEGGADLMLVRPDGTEEVLGDCDLSCSYMDPSISFDGRYVYYTKIEGISTNPDDDKKQRKRTAGFIYKIDLQASAPRPEIQLTFDDGFESLQYAANTTVDHDQGTYREIRDMGPTPINDGSGVTRIMFTSNRAGHTAFSENDAEQNDALFVPSVSHIYVMDDHDGSLDTAEKSNLHRIDYSNMHMAQHPIQLKDGRILFSAWQDVATRFNYAMMSLFTMHPDGSNFQQFTEPHSHKKMVEHFICQTPNETVTSTLYYPGDGNFGYGILQSYPYLSPDTEIQHQRQNHGDDYDHPNDNSNLFPINDNEFGRVGEYVLTPYTTREDKPAPPADGGGGVGKPSYCWGLPGNDLLISYSLGFTNTFDARCEPDECETLKAGIAILSDVTTPISHAGTNSYLNRITMIHDDATRNEIWPKPVLSYNDIYGQAMPDTLPSLEEQNSPLIANGEAAAFTGTSSMLNHQAVNDDDLTNGDPDKFTPNTKREDHDGNWTVQGASAGVFTDDDVYGVRIIAVQPKPFTEPEGGTYQKYITNQNINQVVERYGSFHNEDWKILGEFPLTHKATTDAQGNPDTSWMAKIPSDLPHILQAIDANSMTLYSELAWRSMKAGEVRVDCGGCHAHSIPKLDWDTTQAGQQVAITGVPGVADNDSRIQGGYWDLTSGSTPLLSASGVTFEESPRYAVEFFNDIVPALNTYCVSCHGTGGQSPDFETDPWEVLFDTDKSEQGTTYKVEQRTRYIRIPQARQSLLAWIFWEQRLDGRTNATRDGDVDYPTSHPDLTIPDSVKRNVGRWIDLGGPVNFPETDGMGYTDDNHLPHIKLHAPKRRANPAQQFIRFGAYDTNSGIDWSSLSISYYPVSNPASVTNMTLTNLVRDTNGVASIAMPAVTDGVEYVLKIQVADNTGNVGIVTSKFTVDSSIARPAQPTGVGAL
tara:strand:+ start:1149 stop:4094 length:2946 start_codon:yes stop_codon:yes gene_type:complete